MVWTAPSGHVWASGEVLTAANLNTYVEANLAFLYGDTAWTAVTFANSWVNSGGSLQTAQYRIVGTHVYLRGTIKSGTVNLAAFVLPVGYRPPAQQIFACMSNNLYAQCLIDSSGNVIPQTGASNVWFALDTVSFDTLA